MTPAEALDFASWAPGWLGLAFAVGMGIGCRSGGRGGPLVLEAPVVAHELQAPIDRHVTLHSPAIKQLRFLAFAGIIAGGIVGEVAARRLPVNVPAALIASAAAFTLAAVASAGLAMIVSGRRVGWFMANVVAAVLLIWSAIDIVAKTTTSPATLLAQIAFWPIHFRAIDAARRRRWPWSVVIVGYLILGGMSVEAALRRAGLGVPAALRRDLAGRAHRRAAPPPALARDTALSSLDPPSRRSGRLLPAPVETRTAERLSLPRRSRCAHRLVWAGRRTCRSAPCGGASPR